MAEADWGGHEPPVLGDWLCTRRDGLVRLVVIDSMDPVSPWGVQASRNPNAWPAAHWLDKAALTWHPSTNMKAGLGWTGPGSSRPATLEEIAQGGLTGLGGL